MKIISIELFQNLFKKKPKISDFEQGYEWARSMNVAGESKNKVLSYCDQDFDFTQFDRGALTYVRDCWKSDSDI